MRQRRLMNQINVVPYIDVMLVLLVIFMVTAPMIQTGSVNLPTVDKAPIQTAEAIIVHVEADGGLALQMSSTAPKQDLRKSDLIADVQAAIAADPKQAVLIAADKNVRYERVMNTLNELRNAGVNRVGLQTQVGKSER